MQQHHQNQTLGILGGGQLGRMVIQAAINYNTNIHVLDPDPDAPCRHLVANFTQGNIRDFDTVYAFGQACDIITIEIENVNTDALKVLEKEGKKVFPQPHVIELIQDKRKQKQFYKDNQIPTAPFHLTETKADVAKHIPFLPAVHKLGREGYDGRGVQIIRVSQDLDKAFDAPGLLEKLVDFELEISVIVAQNEQGACKAFPAVACEFHPTANLVEFLFAPSGLEDSLEKKAVDIAINLIQKLDMIGLLAVEMFVTKDREILVNEIAPRPHNSGHHSIEANYTSQFEQHLRAVMGMPLGDTSLRIPAAMINLLGEPDHQGEAYVEGLDEVLTQKGVYVHLYGKKITKPFRKMGHVTILDEDMQLLKSRAMEIKKILKIKAI
ncbi:5-(carboxyamino)imidazole ribonucleotide synthase [Pararhodonellum marinum]|uniref:5-(carboxyamino)imidazole ribonucleotide synthase n=1 Tax=Pararhodonellum marinum TaxID=2755358 RepID=UPI00188DE50D|nr:5-(carboxyamino)imidazole ribonucleotide synthase [Pararhodonellum marinum]